MFILDKIFDLFILILIQLDFFSSKILLYCRVKFYRTYYIFYFIFFLKSIFFIKRF